ncbi:hypothetical protein FRC03_002908, partial [Tulasnella sp. 419]
MSSSYPDPSYHDNYSDPDEDDKQQNGQFGDEDEQEEDEEEDDFVQRPKRESEEEDLVPYQPPTTGPETTKRKLIDGPDTASAPGDSSRNGHTDQIPPAKRNKPEPLEPSILNAEPLDEFVMEIADWIHKHSYGKQHIEVEAKVGMLIDTRTNE